MAELAQVEDFNVYVEGRLRLAQLAPIQSISLSLLYYRVGSSIAVTISYIVGMW